MTGKRMPIEDRFWKYLDVRGPDDCWLWAAYVNPDGYGTLAKGRGLVGNLKIHRLSYTINVGPIPDGLYVCHRCDVRHCGNPKHLFLGTHLDNMRDRDEKGRNPGLRGEKNHSSLLTDEDVHSIRASYGKKEASIAQLAALHAVSYSTIALILAFKTWTHLPLQADEADRVVARVGESCPQSKLTEKEVRAIRDLCARGDISRTQIAKMFGVKRPTVNDIHWRTTWKHLPIRILRTKPEKQND